MILMDTAGETVMMKEFIITDSKHSGTIGPTKAMLLMVNIDLNV